MHWLLPREQIYVKQQKRLVVTRRFSQHRSAYFFLLRSLINCSMAAVMLGAFGCGACRSRRRLFFTTAFAVVGPKAAITVVFCLKSGKFLNNDSIPPGLKNTSISYAVFFFKKNKTPPQ